MQDKRVIKPHKGGRSKSITIRVTPTTVDDLAYIKAKTGESAGDVLEKSVTVKTRLLKAKRFCPEGHEVKFRDVYEKKGQYEHVFVKCQECNKTYRGDQLKTL